MDYYGIFRCLSQGQCIVTGEVAGLRSDGKQFIDESIYTSHACLAAAIPIRGLAWLPRPEGGQPRQFNFYGVDLGIYIEPFPSIQDCYTKLRNYSFVHLLFILLYTY